jgi:hypothetical protein
MSDNHTSDDSDAHIAQREAQVADELAQPRRRSSRSRVRQVLTAGGFPADVFAEGEVARDVRRGRRPTPDLSAYRGHERVTVANLEDDPADV